MPRLLGAIRSRIFLVIILLLVTIVNLLYFYRNSVPIIKDVQYLRAGNRGRFDLESDPPPNIPPYGTIVIAAKSDTDLSWNAPFKANWTILEFDVDKPDHPDPELQFPMSKGHEAMVYLSFIIDHYENLPWSTIFIHGHYDAWHQHDNITNILRGLNRTALAYEGYISFRCDWYPSCPAEMRMEHHDAGVWGPDFQTRGTEAALSGNWIQLFPDEKLPTILSSPCCAQFAVTRQAILGRPKSDYERLRAWLIGSLLEDEMSGRVLEKLWAYIFLGKAVHCPEPQKCACEYFGRCGNNNFTRTPQGVGQISNTPQDQGDR